MSRTGKSSRVAPEPELLPEPEPEPIYPRNFAPFEPFPVDCLPDPVRDYIDNQARALGCDPAVLALPVLSALASAIGSTRRIRLKRAWTEPAVLWTAIVTEQIPRLGEVLDTAADPLLQREARSFRELEADLRTYHQASAEYSLRKRRYRGRGQAPVAPPVPKARRHVVQTWNLPTLVRQLTDQPRGLLVSCEDLDGFLVNSHRSRGAADQAYWFDLHGGKSLTLDRPSESRPTTHIPDACVSLTGAITPQVLLKELTGSAVPGGLGGRLLMAMPAVVPRGWTDDDIDASISRGYASVFDRLLDLQRHEASEPGRAAVPPPPEPPECNPPLGETLLGADWDDSLFSPRVQELLKQPTWKPRAAAEPDPGVVVRSPQMVELSPDAQRCFARFVDEFQRQQQELDDALAATFVHLEHSAARLALVVHLARWAAGEPVDPAVCDRTSMEHGIVLARWFAFESCRILELLSVNSYDQEQQKLIEWLHRRGGRATTRDLCASNGRKYPTAEHARQAMDKLAETGIAIWIDVSPGPSGGRPTKVLSMEGERRDELRVTSDGRVVSDTLGSAVA